MAAAAASVASASSASSASSEVSATAFHPSQYIRDLCAPTVWHHFTPLAIATNSVNLGQGFPDFSPPDFAKEAAVSVVQEAGPGHSFLNHQYARSAGDLALCTVLAGIYSKTLGRTIDPASEIVIQNGASGALFNAFFSLLNPGDEVVVFEPIFDIYLAQITAAGGVIKPVSLTATTDSSGHARWVYSSAELRAAFTSKTRMLVINTPHNPTGKVFSRAELEEMRELVLAHPRCVVLSDEVYEQMCYLAEHPLQSIAALPDMFARSLTINSTGKSLSCTGWKIGWVVGPAHLARGVAVVHQWNSFSVCTPMQLSVAQALTHAYSSPYQGHDTYFHYLKHFYLRKRALIVDALTAAGLKPILPEAGFFVVADTSDVVIPDKYTASGQPDFPHGIARDWAFCRFCTIEIGVACIPPSSFYTASNAHLAANYARFAFCKSDDKLTEAARRLLKIREYLKKK